MFIQFVIEILVGKYFKKYFYPPVPPCENPKQNLINISVFFIL